MVEESSRKRKLEDQEESESKKKRKYDDAGLGKYFEWEHNVTGDCKPSDVLVPFTYNPSRIFNLEPGGVTWLRSGQIRTTCGARAPPRCYPR